MCKLILGIETSCDETAAAVVKDGRHVLSNIISSQIELHEIYGGVVPELASRKHIENIDVVVAQALQVAGVGFNDIDAIAVTNGPGLVGALLVGVNYAKALAYALKKPLIAVHHIEGHICANYLNTKFEPPFVVLVASGGHTHLVNVLEYSKYDVLGRTFDDAAGEAYDKVARVLGLGYPGGPKIDNLAVLGNKNAIAFPRAFTNDGNYNFSFSGLKSAVLNYINKCNMQNIQIVNEDVAACFQEAVIDVLTTKTINAAKEKNIKKIALAGGVASNKGLRNKMKEACTNNGFEINIPEAIFCTDNAAMIASVGYFKHNNKQFADYSLNAFPTIPL